MRDEAWYRERLRQSGVPAHMHDGYVRYLLNGMPPGSFLEAVLSNDLRGACNRADSDNRQTIYQHVYFLYNYAPQSCWGSEEAIVTWVAMHRVPATVEGNQ